MAWATFHAAKHSCRGWVYEVEPEGEIDDDPDMDQAFVGSYTCPRARIVSRVHIPHHRLEHLRHFERSDPSDIALQYYFWLLDNDEAAAEPPPGLSRLKREMWAKKQRKGTLRAAA